MKWEPHIWAVEVYIKADDEWVPVEGVLELSRESARADMNWRKTWAVYDPVRVAKYIWEKP